MKTHFALRTAIAALAAAGMVLACSAGGLEEPGTDGQGVAGEIGGPGLDIAPGPGGPGPHCPGCNWDGGMGWGQDGGTAMLNDASMLQVAVVANQAQIEQGQIAQARGTSQGVRDYGSRMVAEHTAAGARLTAAAQAAGVVPQTTGFSERLRQHSARFTQLLQNLSGRTFDVAYADSQAAAHSHLLVFLDLIALPHVQNPQLKAELQALRPVVLDHLVTATALIQATPPDTSPAPPAPAPPTP